MTVDGIKQSRKIEKLVVWSEMHRSGLEKNVAAEEVSALKEKLSTVHWDDTKDILRVSLEMVGLFAFQVPTCRV